jgi:hypothetical protein
METPTPTLDTGKEEQTVEKDTNEDTPITIARAEWTTRGERIILWIGAILAILQGFISLYRVLIPDKAAERTTQIAEFNRLINEAVALDSDLERWRFSPSAPQAKSFKIRHQNTVRRATQITERYAVSYPLEFTSASLIALGMNLNRINEKTLAIKYFRVSRSAFGGSSDKQESLRQEALTLSSMEPKINLKEARSLYRAANEQAAKLPKMQRDSEYRETILVSFISESLADQCEVVSNMVKKYEFLQHKNIDYGKMWARTGYDQIGLHCYDERRPRISPVRTTAGTAINEEDIESFGYVEPRE